MLNVDKFNSSFWLHKLVVSLVKLWIYKLSVTRWHQLTKKNQTKQHDNLQLKNKPIFLKTNGIFWWSLGTSDDLHLSTDSFQVQLNYYKTTEDIKSSIFIQIIKKKKEKEKPMGAASVFTVGNYH